MRTQVRIQAVPSTVSALDEGYFFSLYLWQVILITDDSFPEVIWNLALK